MKKVQLNFTEKAAQSLNTGATLLSTTTELYDLYSHPEDIQLCVEIAGDDEKDQPNICVDDISLKGLRYVLSQLNNMALEHCVIRLQAYNCRLLQEFAEVCDAPHNDFVVNGCNFRLCEFAERSSNEPDSWSDTLIIHKEEIAEMINNIKNIINNH